MNLGDGRELKGKKNNIIVLILNVQKVFFIHMFINENSVVI